MTNNDHAPVRNRVCCDTTTDELHDADCEVNQPAYCADPGGHRTAIVTEGDYARCGECRQRLADNDPRLTVDETGDVYDATTPPGVTQLPAVTTNMTPAQFKEWLAADGTLFMVILPANRTFVIKVPTAHHEFFVAMMQQVRFALGPEVQAVRMNMVTGPPADVDAATGKADDAPQWAQPELPTEHLITSPNDCPICDSAPGEHCLDPDGSALRDVNGASIIHPARNMVARPAAEQEKPPPCWEHRAPGTLCSFHEGRRAGRVDCWNLRDDNGDHPDDGLTTRCPRGGTCPSDCSRTPDGCQNIERCAHGVHMGIGRYCAECDTSPVKYGPGAAK